MRTDRQRAGDTAEAAVAARLTARGWTVLGHAVRVGRTDLDVVAVDPGPPSSLVVVEVRFRSSRDFGLPEETVDRRKAARLRDGGFVLLDRGSLPDGTRVPRLSLRVDLVAVEPEGDAGGGLTMRHHRGVL